MIKKIWLTGVCLIIVLQAACSNSSYIQKSKDIASWKQIRAEMEAVQQWDIKGKISIRSGEQLYTADMYWQQQKQVLNMRLVAPFSQAVTQFSGSDQQGYQVMTEQGELFDVDSPETVTESAFGVTLPFYELKSWVKGLPNRDFPVWKAEFNNENRLQTFEQSGWHVKILKYKNVSGKLLPSKLFLTRLNENMAENKVDVRLILRRWTL